jgi:hypothetical protein
MSGVDVEVTDSRRINIGDGVTIPKAWDALATGEPNVEGTIRLHVVYDEQLRRTAAASVRLDRAGEGSEVTAVALRDVRVQYLVAVSSIQVVTVTSGTGDAEDYNQYIAALTSRTDRSYEESVREAVRLYRIAATVNVAPLKLVSDQLRVSVSTATRMMARAREAGLAEDLITRETYNRMRADEVAEAERNRPFQGPGSPAGPYIGR